MTRDEARAKCIEAMAIAAHGKDIETDGEPCSWENEIEEVRVFWIHIQTAAFDAIATTNAGVHPTEATDEMIDAGDRESDHYPEGGGLAEIFKAMALTGDLTNPPEKKP